MRTRRIAEYEVRASGQRRGRSAEVAGVARDGLRGVALRGRLDS